MKKIEYLKKRMYINDIKNEKLIKIAEKIEETGYKPEIFTSKWEVLYYFWQLVKWKMKSEDFVMFLDTIFNKKKYQYPVKNWYDGVVYFKNLDNRYKKNKIFVFDEIYEPLLENVTGIYFTF